MHKLMTLSALAATLAVSTGCESSTGPEGTGRVVLQLASGSSATVGFSGIAAASAVDALVVTSVEVVARKIRLKQEDGACSEGESEGEDADCPSLWLDPTLLSPPLAEGTVTEFTVDLPVGSYDELKLQIHKPTGSPKDVIFLASNPGFAGISVRIRGTWNGEPFEYTTSVTAEVEIELEEPIVVIEGVPVAITILVDIQSWFAGSGGALLDPSNPSQQVRSQIDQNIRQSFKAFEDDDGDGVED